MSTDYDVNLGDDSKQKSAVSKALELLFRIPRKLRIVLSIVLFAFVVISLLNAFKPEAKKRAIPETVVRVDVVTAQPSDYPIVVNANGTVEAETRGDLVAQIRGEIIAVSNNFNTGGTFKKGDVLIQIDQRDYQADLSRALANLSQADAVYRQEQATAKQAQLDWQRLGNTEPAPDLVLRKPQLTAAKAQYDSAKAAADSAQLNLSRTTITAPYDGRIINRKAVLGQYVAIGTPIAEVFATDGVEVRLPISQDEFSQLGLDAFSANSDAENPFTVSITSTVGNKNHQWDAKVTRTDSTFDINTRQIDVVAEVKDPFGKISGQTALKIGQFVSARIQGRTIENVFVIPNKSIREGSYVYTVRDGKLAKQSINILWQDDQNALIDGGINDGELVVTTSLNSTLAGASAKLGDDTATASPATDAVEPAITEEDIIVEEGVVAEEIVASKKTVVSEQAEDAAPIDDITNQIESAIEGDPEQALEVLDLPVVEADTQTIIEATALDPDAAQATKSTPSE
ncbi:MAG: RND family efflux transporter MFP subunit [Arenicella sp.]|jgi:RND family efflux transporter MFP subunit